MILPILPTMRTSRNLSHRSRDEQIVTEGEVKLEKVCWPCRRNRRRGAAAVEFAVVAPVFFLMIFGMIEFGRMVMVQQILTNASREGARLGVLDNIVESDVVQTVVGYASSGRVNVTSGDVTVVAIDDVTGAEKPYASSDYGDSIEVTVTVPFGQVSWLPSSFFGNSNKDLTATTVMRRETVQ